jgi:hypothetical protein
VPPDSPAHLTPLLVSKLAARQDANPILKHMPERVGRSQILTRLSDGRTVAHLINHNYSQGFQEQDGVRISFPVAKGPRSVTLVSPDYGADTPMAFTYSGGQVQVTVPKFVAYVAVVSN